MPEKRWRVLPTLGPVCRARPSKAISLRLLNGSHPNFPGIRQTSGIWAKIESVRFKLLKSVGVSGWETNMSLFGRTLLLLKVNMEMKVMRKRVRFSSK